LVDNIRRIGLLVAAANVAFFTVHNVIIFLEIIYTFVKERAQTQAGCSIVGHVEYDRGFVEL
jgi:hypothetical protein